MRKSMLVAIILTFGVMCTGCGGNESQPAANTSAQAAVSSAEETGIETSATENEILVSVWAGPHADLQKQVIRDGYRRLDHALFQQHPG